MNGNSMKRISVGIVIVALFAFTTLWLLAQTQRGQQPMSNQPQLRNQTFPSAVGNSSGASIGTLAGQSHSITQVAATPNVISTNATASVTVSAVIADPTVIPNSVNLLRLNGGGNQPPILGQLHGDQNGNYSIQVAFDEATAGQISLQISAAFRGDLKRTLSNIITVGVNTQGVVLSIPPQFQIDGNALTLGGPVSLTNFGAQYQQGGIVPPGGAELDFPSIPLPTTTLDTLIAYELAGATITSSSTVSVDGVPCRAMSYTDSYGGGLTYNNVAVYCPHGGLLYKMYLSDRSGDSMGGQFLDSFQQILSSIQFAE